MDNPSHTLLIMAHPGHELLLHHWLERQQSPLVMAMTDGSGSSAHARTASSCRVLERTGARLGPHFGARSDREWYAAILAQDADPFLAFAQHALEAMMPISETAYVFIVVDAIEYFNPVHDFAAICGFVAGRMIAARGARVSLATYAIEKPNPAEPIMRLSLNEMSLARKLASIDSYTELTAEVRRVRQSSGHIDIGTEALYAIDVANAFPARLNETPFYETFGRERMRENKYGQLITYDDHVRPLAMRLIEWAQNDKNNVTAMDRAG